MIRNWVFLAGVAVLWGCGGGEIESSLVAEGSVLNARPATLREDGQPVSGTVVHRNAEGQLLESVEYVDGFPTGEKRTWYANGQLERESVVRFRRHNNGGGLMSVGPSRTYCENGQMSEERLYDEEGRPTGKYRSWTCKGELLNVASYPSGEYRTASELEDGTVWVNEEGMRDEAGKWVGEHKRFHPNGQLALKEQWKDGALQGAYEEWDEEGKLKTSGHYAAGQRIGTWRTVMNGFENVQDFDISNFVDPAYTGPFLQAAGIQTQNSGAVAKLPLQDYRVDEEKLRYYVSEGLVDPRKKLHNGPIPNPFVSSSWTYAYVRASRPALPILEDLGADPKAMDSDGRSRLHHCIFSLADGSVCNTDEMKRLIGLGLAVDSPDTLNYTPLLDLVITSWNWRWAPTPAVQLEVAKLLVDAGADPDRLGGREMLTPQRDGLSPLMAAANAKRFELADFLLERSKQPNATNALGYNLVHLVFLDQQLRQFSLQLKDDARGFIERAVARGVDPHVPLPELGTMKEIAQRAGAIDVARFLSGLEARS